MHDLLIGHHVPIAVMLLVDVVFIVTVAHLAGALARRCGQPAVIGEITAGLLLGPTLLQDAAGVLFPVQVRPALGVQATVGVCVFTFFIGRHLDRDLLAGQGRVAVVAALSTLVVPFVLGAGLAVLIAEDHPVRHRVAFVLFLATAMSVTAFPVLARILVDRGLLHTPVGGLALACAAIDDVLGWSLLAVVAALARGGGPWALLLVVPYLAVLLGVVRPALARLVPWAERGRVAAGVVLVALSAGLWASAWATEQMGLHAIFGAFALGSVMPPPSVRLTLERALAAVERLNALALLPVFFVVAGLKIDLSGLDATAWGELALILLVAIGGKFIGAYAGARLGGVRTRHCVVLAVLANTRGLTELIVLSVGLEIGVLDRQLFSLMVVMALVTTAMTGVLLRFAYPEAMVRADLAARRGRRAADGSALQRLGAP